MYKPGLASPGLCVIRRYQPLYRHTYLGCDFNG